MSAWRGDSIVGSVAKEAFTDMVTNPKEVRSSHVTIWEGKELQAKEPASPKALTTCLAFLWNTKKARGTGDE